MQQGRGHWPKGCGEKKYVFFDREISVEQDRSLVLLIWIEVVKSKASLQNGHKLDQGRRAGGFCGVSLDQVQEAQI